MIIVGLPNMLINDDPMYTTPLYIIIRESLIRYYPLYLYIYATLVSDATVNTA